ncbi:MAG: hypothetical protein UU65_C0003G0177 [candidate division CPR2 bacterium GW2011_GWC1_41_48]|uniref:HD domain-containing protein n=1 Tax=candidate division CPR2 bacterium GW2011_GWC1_41_48 TaxID=1618344 RepID=A0A0G0WAP4_UNCC2|nr:MAG: hypothetical protein UT47_C0003G0183 [candidate division CPR2 bacterium GW2011_GWC2_39_35]KKR29234.1 MAG: hypothetical protein UT60_C0005G0039 [candidate division CPR2 bacterium GW2011_GWD2_39_7]KKS09122.1 MAG: hypothetical protein UU65_C0003G0177 [candidate division CPR2 bacterium GW2011_GWC1_41_48]
MAESELIQKIEKEVFEIANKNGWEWFYKVHMKPMVKSANELLKLYPEANKEIVIIAAWLHDTAKIYAKDIIEFEEIHKTHHLESAEVAKDLLLKHKELTDEKIEEILSCIIRHRNSKDYPAKTLEEKIVTVADTLSHFRGAIYLIHFKFFPEHSLEQMAHEALAKLDRDWRDLKLLPEAPKLAETEYQVLKKMLESYLED